MGAKTTQFTSDVQKFTGECQVAALTMMQALADFRPVEQEYKALTDQHAKRVNEITGDMQWRAGSAPAKFAAAAAGKSSEQVIDSDPKIKSLNAKMDQTEGRLNKWMGETMNGRKNLAVKVALLKKKVDEFEAYVKAKESKWFGGKKSVPAAKVVIKTAREYVKDFASV